MSSVNSCRRTFTSPSLEIWSEDWKSGGRTQSGSSGKGGEGKGGHAIIEPKYLSRFKDFLGDERSWKDWLASLTTAVIQKMNQEKPDGFAALGMLAKSTTRRHRPESYTR